MNTLVFDTETTGTPPKNPNTPLRDCPWIIQLAAVMFNDRKPVGYFSTYVEPAFNDERGVIPNEKFWIENNLTEAEIMPTALRLPAAMAIFQNLVRRCDRLVAHNFSFDQKQINYSYRRINGDHFNWAGPNVCTMLSSMPVVAIPSKFPKPDEPHKWPTLDEAYRKLVNPNGFSGAHDALADCLACAEVLFSLEDAGHPLTFL